jgi:CHAT domain-containing protein
MADGHWRGTDVAQGDYLRSSPIVVLSACETGTGKIFDVGLMGLNRAWYQAGASSVIASLWRVDERIAKELTTLFVEKAMTMPPDIALGVAMKYFRDKRKEEPGYWAAFSVLGGLAVR